MSTEFGKIIIKSEVIHMFFKKKKAVSAPKEPQPTIILSVPYSEHFRGFKRMQLSTVDDKEAEKGIKATQAAEIVDRIKFVEYKFPDTPPLMRVYADDNKLGTMWSTVYTEYYEAVRNGHCKKASFAFSQSDDVYLYLKFE